MAKGLVFKAVNYVPHKILDHLSCRAILEKTVLIAVAQIIFFKKI